MLEVLEFLAGLALSVYLLNDVFQSVVVPRSTPSRFRISRLVIVNGWRVVRAVGLRSRTAGSRERLLGTFAPMVVILLLLIWISGLIIGFGLMLYAFRGSTTPPIENLGSAIYAAGTSLLTISFSNIVANSGGARLVSIAAGMAGLGTIALAISFLFSIYATFQRREILIVTLDARAGAPPSGVTLLATMAKLGVIDDLPRFFGDWEKWAAEVLDSHLAYPVLAYFRSSHDNESWVSALGAVLDATTLLLTTCDGGPHGPAKLMYAMGTHLVEDLGRFFNIESDHDVGVERYEFDQAREQLAAAGWTLRPADESWVAFSRLRIQYAVALNNMAKRWAAPPTQWIGDRSYVRFTARRHEEVTARAASR
ncbi:MAG: two pore domain potassium channel family protein [Chloroflexi bacterium]|nr:MAG: two pore domain potassium channel family protein [Chloroflexota bacterium]